MRLKGKVALITGAANGLQGELMGIGGATAWLFAREGAKVVLGDVNDELGQRTASQIRDSGDEAQFVHLDVARAGEWSDAVKAAVDRFGRLDILVNCAGNREPNSYSVDETTEELWDEVMDTHARGTFLGMKHAVPKMRDSGGGSIINISSVLGMVGQSDRISYVAAKGAIRLMTKAVAVESAGENIRVNSVHPGTVLTPQEPGPPHRTGVVRRRDIEDPTGKASEGRGDRQCDPLPGLRRVILRHGVGARRGRRHDRPVGLANLHIIASCGQNAGRCVFTGASPPHLLVCGRPRLAGRS